jgi:DNA-binding transcriptional ArsR family regulator
MIVGMARRLSDVAFQALGDPNRRAILEELGHGGQSVAELTRRVGISQPAVSRHLRLLKGAGLVDDYPDGAKNIYRLRREGAEAVRKYIENLWGEAAVRFRLAADNTSRRKRR